ncbi:MAG: copper homeostasis membrane protein CopD [Sphingorhabdus sp.]
MTEQLNIGVRFALYANMMLLFGLPLFGIYSLNAAERQQDAVFPFRAFTGWLSPIGIALSLLSITAMTASMMGVQLNEVDAASIKTMIVDTPMGNAWAVRVLVLICILLAVILSKTEGIHTLGFVTLGSGVALGSLAWTGHGAASEGMAGSVQLIADIIHLLAVGAWLGALVILTFILFRAGKTPSESYLKMGHRLLKGFSTIGTVIVSLIVASGLVNSWMLVGPNNLMTLQSTLYGQLLMVKLLLFGIMLALAAVNRFTLTPALERALQSTSPTMAVTKLQKSLVVELTLIVAIVGLVAWIGTYQPPSAM